MIMDSFVVIWTVGWVSERGLVDFSLVSLFFNMLRVPPFNWQ